MLTREKRAARKAELFGDLIAQMELRQQRVRSEGHVKRSVANAATSAHGSMQTTQAPESTTDMQEAVSSFPAEVASGPMTTLGTLRNKLKASSSSGEEKQRKQRRRSYGELATDTSSPTQEKLSAGKSAMVTNQSRTQQQCFRSKVDELAADVRAHTKVLPADARRRLLCDVRELLISARSAGTCTDDSNNDGVGMHGGESIL